MVSATMGGGATIAGSQLWFMRVRSRLQEHMFRSSVLEKTVVRTCSDRAHVKNLKNKKPFMLLSFWVAFCPPIRHTEEPSRSTRRHSGVSAGAPLFCQTLRGQVQSTLSPVEHSSFGHFDALSRDSPPTPTQSQSVSMLAGISCC